jgi:hypothetical protein
MTSHDLPSGDGPRADRPKRRTFTVAYKLRMVEEYDAAEHGEKKPRPGGRSLSAHVAGLLIRCDIERIVDA